MTEDDVRPTTARASSVDASRWILQSEYATSALDWLFDHEFLGPHATAAAIGLVAAPDSLVLVGAVGDLPPLPRDQPVSIPLSGELPLCRSARLGVCSCMPTAEEIRWRSPWLAAFAPRAAAAVAVPVRVAGRPIGAIGVTYATEWKRRADQLLGRLTDIGDSLGASLRASLAPTPPWEWLDWGSRPA